MKPYGSAGRDPLLVRAMSAYRRDHRGERARDPIRSVTAPRKSDRQFACRLCGFHWLPFRAPMPTDLASDRSTHRCWVPAEVYDIVQRLANADGGLATGLNAVLRDRLEELTGQRETTPYWEEAHRRLERRATPDQSKDGGS